MPHWRKIVRVVKKKEIGETDPFLLGVGVGPEGRLTGRGLFAGDILRFEDANPRGGLRHGDEVVFESGSYNTISVRMPSGTIRGFFPERFSFVRRPSA